LRTHGGGHLATWRDRLSLAIDVTGIPEAAGLGRRLFGLYRLRLCCLGPGRCSGTSRQPPTVQKHLSFAGSLFLPGGREKVGENASTGLLATAPLGVMGRSSRRDIGPSKKLWVRLPGQIDPAEDRGRHRHGSHRSAEHTIGLAEGCF
jgi:hypothetical protein